MSNQIPETVFVFVSPGVKVDAGGIVVGADGKIHRVPPWNPEVLSELTAAATLVAQAGAIKNANLSQQLTKLAEGILTARRQDLQHATRAAGRDVTRDISSTGEAELRT